MYHLGRLKVGHETEPARVAELAIHGASHLRGHADGVAGLPLWTSVDVRVPMIEMCRC